MATDVTMPNEVCPNQTIDSKERFLGPRFFWRHKSIILLALIRPN